MPTTLTIRWDGTAPGLPENALSVAAWSDPLWLMLMAMRRTASGILRDALEPQYGAKGGRFAKFAETLDLRLTTIESGCVVASFDIEVDPDALRQQDLYQDLIVRTAVRFLDDAKAEAAGHLQNVAVRKYLSALPDGVSRHEYILRKDGVEKHRVEFGAANVVATVADMPGLHRIVGHVVAVGFEPGEPKVTIRGDGRTVSLDATLDQVEAAIGLRNQGVVAMCVLGTSHRLVWLRAAGDEPTIPTPASRLASINAKWARALEILSR